MNVQNLFIFMIFTFVVEELWNFVRKLCTSSHVIAQLLLNLK